MKRTAPLPWILLAALLSVSPRPATAQVAPGDTASAAGPALPDSSDFEMEKVIITGTRVRAKIIDIPFAVERLSMEDVPYARKVAVDDVLGEVPGLFLQSRYGNHDVRVSMRGFGSRSNSGIRGVRILMDGIPESEPDGQTRIEGVDLQAVGRIEVVKGNASSLYTNAPGGVINFIGDTEFPETFFTSFNQAGSFDLHQNGFKSGVRTDRYALLTTYSYHTASGYRAHSDDYWHIANVALEVNPHDTSRLSLFGYVVDGRLRLPGSLTRAQFDADPRAANPRDVSRDTKRITKKGRLGVRFETDFGDDELEITTYGTVKYFERTAGNYRIFNRDGFGATVRHVNRQHVLGRRNEISGALDWFYQYGPIQAYDNINGRKGDILQGLTDERISNVGFYVSDSYEFVPDRLSVLATGRYDRVGFKAKNRILEVQNAEREYDDFTPKAALNLKLTPMIAVYTSYGLGFDTPAFNELDNFPTSSSPNGLLNPDLNPQHSRNFELGIKGGVLRFASPVLQRIGFEASFFAIRVEDEIVPFDVQGEVFYRNSAETRRKGVELGLDAVIVDGLRFKSAYTYSDFKYDTYSAGTVSVDSLGNIVLATQDFSGNVVPSVPKNNVSLSLAYERDLAERVTAFAKVHYSVTGGVYADDANAARADAYRLLDPSVGADVRFGAMSLLVSAGVNNALDETYVGFVNINSASGEFYEAGVPRNYYVGVDLGRRF